MKKTDDNNLHLLIGIALRTGVILSITFMFFGGIGYLSLHGQNMSNFSSFKPVKPSFSHIWKGVFSIQAESVIYLGIILLITTPIMRVLLSALSFAFEKDWLYTTITGIVLSIIIFSIMTGYAG